MFVIAIASNFNGFLVGMAISGLGFGVYAAVDFALVADVLPNPGSNAKDLGVFNIAAAPFPSPSRRRGRPAILAIGGGSYGVLYAEAGACAIVGAVADPARERGPLTLICVVTAPPESPRPRHAICVAEHDDDSSGGRAAALPEVGMAFCTIVEH